MRDKHYSILHATTGRICESINASTVTTAFATPVPVSTRAAADCVSAGIQVQDGHTKGVRVNKGEHGHVQCVLEEPNEFKRR